LVQAKLCLKWSPEQISDHLAAALPDRQEMQVSPETIYQALYVQGRGHRAMTCINTCGERCSTSAARPG